MIDKNVTLSKLLEEVVEEHENDKLPNDLVDKILTTISDDKDWINKNRNCENQELESDSNVEGHDS